METINERIQKIIDQYYRGNVTAFSRDVGVTQGTIRDIVSGRKNSPTSKTIEKILNVTTVNINPAWLIQGKTEFPINTAIQAENDKEVTQQQIKIKYLQERIDELQNEVKELTGIKAVQEYIIKELNEKSNLK